MADQEESTRDDEPPEKERTKTVVRRVGRTVLLGGGFALFVFLMVGVVQGIQQDRAWNPYTGRLQREADCLESARELLLEAGRMDRLTPSWMNRYRKWVARCKENHGEPYELLRETHSELQELSEGDS